MGLVYGVLVLLFRSFFKPLIIISALPLAIFGGILGLLFMGLQARHALADRLSDADGPGGQELDPAGRIRHRARTRATRRREAMLEATRERARPIVMTSLAMMAGMLPTALTLGKGSEFRQPMAVAVIGGLITSTVLSLVLVPVVYEIVDTFEAWIRPEARQAGHAEGGSNAPPAARAGRAAAPPIVEACASRQQPLMVAAHGAVAFAGALLQAAAVQDVDDAAAIADEAPGLQSAGDRGLRRALDAQHVGEEFLGQADGVDVDAVAAGQQPAAEPRLHRVQRVAGHRLDGVAVQRLVVAVDQVAHPPRSSSTSRRADRPVCARRGQAPGRWRGLAIRAARPPPSGPARLRARWWRIRSPRRSPSRSSAEMTPSSGK